MAQNDIGVDLGTTSVMISVEGKGIVLNELAAIAVDTRTDRVLAVGDEAFKMIGRTPAYIKGVFPLQNGVIADYMLTKELLKTFISRASGSLMIKPRVVICIPSSVTGVESNAVIEAAEAAGARQVFLIEEPMAAALGCNIDITKPEGNIILDIGGGTSDVAVISMGGKVLSTSIRVAGNTIDEEIVKHVRAKYGLVIGTKTAERIKKEIGCANPKSKYSKKGEVKGRSLITNLPQRIELETKDLYAPIEDSVNKIAELVRSTIEKTPPELVGDIYTNGLYMTGGGALLHGFDELLSERLKIKVRVAENPENCVVNGTLKSLSLMDKLESGIVRAVSKVGR